MRIALTHAHCWPDVLRGGERYLHELASALARSGHDVTIWSASSQPGEREEEGVRVVRLPRRASGAQHETRFGRQLLPRLLRERYDVVHSLGPADASAAIVATRLGRAGRTVFTNLGLPDQALWRARRDWRYHEFVVRHVDVYACLSPYAAGVFEASYGRPATVTSGGVRLSRFPLGGQRSSDPTLLFAGTFDDPMKNVPVLLAAMDHIVSERPDARLLLIGPGDPTPHLSGASPTAREHTEVLPTSTELAEHYGQAWATVLPSKWESFALVLVESMACGTPVVVTNHAASPERVLPGTGIVCDPDDPQALALACLQGLELAAEPDIRTRCQRGRGSLRLGRDDPWL